MFRVWIYLMIKNLCRSAHQLKSDLICSPAVLIPILTSRLRIDWHWLTIKMLSSVSSLRVSGLGGPGGLRKSRGAVDEAWTTPHCGWRSLSRRPHIFKHYCCRVLDQGSRLIWFLLYKIDIFNKNLILFRILLEWLDYANSDLFFSHGVKKHRGDNNRAWGWDIHSLRHYVWASLWGSLSLRCSLKCAGLREHFRVLPIFASAPGWFPA